MNALNQFLFGYYPYICLTVFLLGSLIRFDRDQYTWKSDSSQLLRSGLLRWGSNLFHIGILFLFFGHVLGLLTPHAFYGHFLETTARLKTELKWSFDEKQKQAVMRAKALLDSGAILRPNFEINANHSPAPNQLAEARVENQGAAMRDAGFYNHVRLYPVDDLLEPKHVLGQLYNRPAEPGETVDIFGVPAGT